MVAIIGNNCAVNGRLDSRVGLSLIICAGQRLSLAFKNKLNE